jgi:hypothetical protein
MKVKLVTRDNAFVRDGDIPPFQPPPEVITWGSRVFVHGLAHRPDAKNNTSGLPEVYFEGLAYPLEVADAETRKEPAQ